MKFTGKVWVFGDDLNTDAMYPGFAMKMDPPEAAKHIFYEVRPGWTDEVSAGDIVMAGKNFGVGSSRPVAALFAELGVAGLVAEEFNSLFFRNAVNAGLPAMTVPRRDDRFQRRRYRDVRPQRRQLAQRDYGRQRDGHEAAAADSRHHCQRRRTPPAGRAGLHTGRVGRCAAIERGCDAQRGKRRVMAPLGRRAWPLLGKLLRRFRAGEARSPLAGAEYAGAAAIDVTSAAFTDGGPIPQQHAGEGVGDNVSPALQWSGVPADAKQLVLIMDDVDVPMPTPLMHTIAVIEPDLGGLGEGELKPGTTGIRLVKAFGDTYVGPRPIPGHGPHHYRFLVLALDQKVPDWVADHGALIPALAGHVLARGVLTGTYER